MKVFVCIFFVPAFILFSSCRHQTALDDALKLSGNNRVELEKVLKHYSRYPADSLKYRAACFLIKYMPYQYSVDPGAVEKIQPVYDQHRSISERFGWKRPPAWGNAIDSLEDVYLHDYKLDLNKNIYPDIRYITSDYLIIEIDLAFKAWKENTYSQQVPFSDFCEYVLPYRRQDGYLLEDSRVQFYERHSGYFSGQHASFEEATDSILYKYVDFLHSGSHGAGIPVYSIATLEQIKRGFCEHRCCFNSCLLSALGMPVVIDFVPHWGNRSSSHSWNALVLDGETYPFEPFWDNDRWKYKVIYSNTVSDQHWGKLRLPKVFRKTYSITEEGPVTDKNVDREDIPSLFRNLKMKDVSGQYFQTVDVKMKLTEEIPQKAAYCYLAVFGQQQWYPVQWGKISGDEVEFERMGCDVVYLPVYYANGNISVAADPFYIEPSGRIKKLIKSDEYITINTCIVNSQKVVYDLNKKLHLLRGGHISGFQTGLKVGIDTLHRVPVEVDVFYNSITIAPQKSYQSIRVEMPSDHFALCEIAFYVDGGGVERRIFPKSISSNLIPLNNSQSTDLLVDGLSATGFQGKTKNSSQKAFIDIDLGESYELSRIVYVPYSGSFIDSTAIYELFYWDKEWKSAGTREGTNESLRFENVPGGNCLYMIKDRSVGKNSDERIFLYEDGFVKWM